MPIHSAVGVHFIKLLIHIAFLVAAACLAGCQPPNEPLRIVSSPWPGYEPFYLARDLGYLDKASVRLNELPTANITLEAFSNGSAEIATITLDETLTLLAQGKKLRVLMVIDVSNGADAVMAKPSIRSLPELKGKRIAMENIPLGVYMLNRLLDAAKLKAEDVTVVPMPEDQHEKAYLQGKIDAAITMEPNKTRLAHAGAHVLFDSSRIPNEIFDLLVAREDVYQARRDELCRLTQQWFRTLDYVQANQQDAFTRMGKRLGMDVPSYRTMMAGVVLPSRQENQRLLGGTSPALIAPARRLADIMQRNHMLSVPVDIAPSIDADFAACLK